MGSEAWRGRGGVEGAAGEGPQASAPAPASGVQESLRGLAYLRASSLALLSSSPPRRPSSSSCRSALVWSSCVTCSLSTTNSQRPWDEGPRPHGCHTQQERSGKQQPGPFLMAADGGGGGESWAQTQLPITEHLPCASDGHRDSRGPCSGDLTVSLGQASPRQLGF